jgi:hypothetical protein
VGGPVQETSHARARVSRVIGRIPGSRFLPRHRSRKLLDLGFLTIVVTAAVYFGTILNGWKASVLRTVLLLVVLVVVILMVLLAVVSVLVSPEEALPKNPEEALPENHINGELDSWWTEKLPKER